MDMQIFLSILVVGYAIALEPLSQKTLDTEWPKMADESRDMEESRFMEEPRDMEEPYCFICQIIVVTVEMQIIGNNATMNEIVEAVSSVCDALGGPDSEIVKTCHNLVETYLEQIIDMITVNFFQPYDVCVKLQACP